MTKTEVPVEARDGEDTALYGLTTQGNFFMQKEEGGVPYIWNEPDVIDNCLSVVEDKYGTHENHRLIFQESVCISFDLRVGKNDGRKK